MSAVNVGKLDEKTKEAQMKTKETYLDFGGQLLKVGVEEFFKCLQPYNSSYLRESQKRMNKHVTGEKLIYNEVLFASCKKVKFVKPKGKRPREDNSFKT